MCWSAFDRAAGKCASSQVRRAHGVLDACLASGHVCCAPLCRTSSAGVHMSCSLSVNVFVQVACITHFQSQPLSFLAAAPDLQAVQEQCAALEPALLQHGLQGAAGSSAQPAGAAHPAAEPVSQPSKIRGKKGRAGKADSKQAAAADAEQLSSTLHSVRRAWMCWALALQWLQTASALASRREGTHEVASRLCVSCAACQAACMRHDSILRTCHGQCSPALLCQPCSSACSSAAQ